MQQRNKMAQAMEALPDDRIERLREALPEIFSDGRLDADKLKQLCDQYGPDDERTPGYYGLYWPGKAEAKREAYRYPTDTLAPVPGDGVDEDTTHNIYIEGDNLKVLRILKRSYENRVKLIYIDPPYNTGSDFVYHDDYAMDTEEYLKASGQIDDDGKRLQTNPKSSGRYHTDWLSMMMPRLMLAKDLLSDDGVIFISIDDNEQANLKLICDDVFGQEKFCGIFPWRKRTAKSDVPFGISQDFEYVLVYANDEFVASIEGGTRKYYETNDLPNRPWRVHDLTKQTSASERPNSFFTIVNPKNGKKYPANPNRTWAITEETFQEYYKQNRIVFPGDYDFLKISKPALRYWKEDDENKAGENFGKIPVSTKFPDNIGMSQEGTKDFMSLFGGKEFSFPKPVSLVKFLMKISTRGGQNAIILDFFSGSATTAQAVMQLNAEDGGTRKYIMVQVPEPCAEKSEAYKAGYHTICEIGKERIRRAGKKILDEHPELKGKLDVGFRVYRHQAESNIVAYSPVKGTDEKALGELLLSLDDQMQSVVPGCDLATVLGRQRLFAEVLLRQGFALDSHTTVLDELPQNRVVMVNDPDRQITLYVCLDTTIEDETIEKLALQDTDKFICLNTAISDTAYARLCDHKGRVETI